MSKIQLAMIILIAVIVYRNIHVGVSIPLLTANSSSSDMTQPMSTKNEGRKMRQPDDRNSTITTITQSSLTEPLVETAFAFPQEQEQCIDTVQLCRTFGNQQPHQSNTTETVTTTLRRTLALGDPSLRGGFRNQYLRFTSLIAYAWKHNYTEILLPSIKWFSAGSILLNSLRESQDNATIHFSAVPFSYMYNVQHWNTFQTVLPKMVDYSPEEHSQWNPATWTLYNICPFVEAWYRRPPSTDLSNVLRHLTNPYAAGGGAGVGELWKSYRREYDSSGTIRLANGTRAPLELLERTMATALRPSMAMQAILDQIPHRNNNNYLAFHARFEPEMLVHFMCNNMKERSMTKVVDWIRAEPDFATMESLFMAISMPDMVERYRFDRLLDVHNENVKTMTHLMAHGLSSTIPTWMAGEDAVRPHVNPCMLQLVASFINLELAVNAKFFLGTRTSTWSVGVWKLRYFRGLPNYEFTNEGIQKIEGAPKPFKC